jgi:hypothetical protein
MTNRITQSRLNGIHSLDKRQALQGSVIQCREDALDPVADVVVEVAVGQSAQPIGFDRGEDALGRNIRLQGIGDHALEAARNCGIDRCAGGGAGALRSPTTISIPRIGSR